MTGMRTVLLSALLVAGNSVDAQRSSLTRVDQLRTDVTAFAHDSMAGRLAGSEGAYRAGTALIARFTAAGLLPGLKSSFVQDVPLVQARLDTAGAAFTTLTFAIDFLPMPGLHGLAFPRRADASGVVFGGRIGTSSAIAPARAKGKIVVMLPPLRVNGQPEYQVWGNREWLVPYRGAGSIAVVGLELLPSSIRRMMTQPQLELKLPNAADSVFPPIVMVSRAGASFLLGKNADAAELGKDTISMPGTMNFRVASDEPKRPSRNVIGILEGSDPQLKSQFVVLAARYDGFGVDAPDADTRSAWPATTDSIMNGADEVSGAVALLNIAENLAKASVRPKRSIMFVLTVGGESRQAGAQWFVEHSPFPRENIVANIDVGAVGRGGAEDTPGGGPVHVQAAGSRRLSTAFGDWIDEVGKASGAKLSIDYSFDAPNHPARYNCAGGHSSFARVGIPAVFLTTGAHAESRTVSDAVDRIDFDKLGAIADFISELATDIANRPARPTIDKPKPDPHKPCVQ